MSQQLATSGRARRDLLRRLVSEPLVQFLLAGAALLAIQQLIAPARADTVAADRIMVSQQAVESLKAAFAQEHGRAPTDAEFREAIGRHVDGEVLYREALRYGLDRSDVIVRREMQRKMRFLIEDLDPLPEPAREELQAWLDAHAERYAQPARISFQQVFLSRARHGPQLPFVAGERLAALRARPDSFRSLSDPFPAGLVLAGADRQRLEKEFGGEFSAAVLQLPPGQWSEPLRSSLGLHLVRVTARSAARPVSVEEAGKALVVDVRAAQRDAANRRALDRLRARYRVEIAGAQEGAS